MSQHITRLLACCLLFALFGATNAATPQTATDRSHFPKSYGILANGHLIHPIDMGDWPLKIDCTHQLFVDDYLIATMENLERKLHQAVKHPDNPIMVPDRPWEKKPTRQGCLMTAVRRDEKTGRFRMWYAGYRAYETSPGKTVVFPSCYAESEDGIHWTKPELGLVEFEGSKKNNIIWPEGWLMLVENPEADSQPQRRYLGIVALKPNKPGEGYFLLRSPDGIHWTPDGNEPLALLTNRNQSGIGDTSQFRWDPKLQKYICDAKILFRNPTMRARGFMESDDLRHWTPPRMTIYPDTLDDPDSQIYGNISFCYESMWLGFLRVMHQRPVSYKQTTVEMTCSRDGRHWSRVGNREELIPLGANDAWDAHYHDPIAPILIGDELWIYYRSTNNANEKEPQKHGIGLAKLRRDGFVSLTATDTPGTVTTRPLSFPGKRLFINADIREGGSVKVGILSEKGEPLKGHNINDCVPITKGAITIPVSWKNAPEFSLPDGSHVRLRFELKNADLYSFWFE
ncbi:MAG: hypothetical protein JXM70_21040 [Pirellulales bacterium]|nr:hypothetical protein [Pirellulales bacterium]